MGSSSRRIHAAFGIGLVLVLAVGYGGVLDAPFVFDDWDSIEANAGIQVADLSMDSLGRAASSPPYDRRPLANLTFAVNHRFGGLDPLGYRVANLAIHAAAATALYLLLLALLGRPGATTRPAQVAALSALLWAAHPIQTESVTYVTQRMTSLAGLFYLSSVALYLTSRAAGGARRAVGYAAVVLLGVLALLTKENSATLPFALALVDWVAPSSRRPRRWAIPAAVGIVGLVAAILLLPRAGSDLGGAIESLRTGEKVAGRPFSTGERLLTQSRVVFLYLELLAWPAPGRLNLDRDVRLSTSIASPPATLAAVLALAGLAVLAVRVRRRSPLLSFAILWFGLTLSVESTIVPLELAFEHRLYLPSVGPILLAVAWGWPRFASRPDRVPGVVALGVLAAAAWATRERNEVWRSEESLYRDAAEKSPRKARPRYNLGVALVEKGDLDGAARAFARALDVDPGHLAARYDLARVDLERGRHDDVVRVLEAIPGGRLDAEGLYYLARAHARLGHHEVAADCFARSLALAPDRIEVRQDFAIALAEAGRPEEALEQLGLVLERAPGIAETQLFRADLLAGLGRLEEAFAALDALVERDPGLARARADRGMLLLRAGRREAALLDLGVAWRSDPDRAEWANAYGALLGEVGRLDESVEVLERLLETQPRLVAARLNLARSLEPGDPDRALECYESALREEPGWAEIHARMARFFAVVRPDRQARIAHARRALDLEPDRPDRAELERWALP